MNIRKILPFLLMVLFSVAAASWAAPSPTEQVQEAVDQIFEYLNDEQMPAEERNQKIEELVRNRFDFDVMSQWILGINWRKATPEQRETFKELFTDLLEANYRGSIGEYAEQYTDERVEYAGERVLEDRAMVDTFVVTKEKRIPISYKMILQGDEWKVYDVVIEEVSLVRNYRSTYDDILRKQGFEGLFSRMREKIEELKSGKGEPAGEQIGASKDNS